jgi:hypothetical protein
VQGLPMRGKAEDEEGDGEGDGESFQEVAL